MAEKKAKFISHTSICGKGKVLAAKLTDGEAREIMKVYGLAISKRDRESKFGTQAEFRGQFEAVNMTTGDVYNANKLYLPTEPSLELENSLASDKEGKGVKFAYTISIVSDEKSQAGYFFDFESLMKPVASDALVEMREIASINGFVKGSKSSVVKK
jgi:hypothetical protein